MTKNNNKKLLSILSALAFSTGSMAVDGSFDLGESLFDPGEKFFHKSASPLTVQAGGGYADNFNPLAQSDLPASFATLAGKGNLVTKQQAYWFEAKYLAISNQFNLDDTLLDMDDGFSQFDLGLNNRLFITDRLAIDLNGRYTRYEEQMGTGISKFRPGVTKSDRATIGQGSVSLTYGADPVYRSLALTYVRSERDYQDINSYSELFDLEQDLVSLYTNFRISDLTQLISLLEYRKVTSPLSEALDSELYSFLTGVEWQPGGKTKVLALLGYYQRNYQQTEDTSGLNWELAVDYFPREDLHLSLISEQRSTAGDSSEFAVDTLESRTEAGVIYRYSEQWWYGLSARYQTVDFDEVSQTRKTKEFHVGALARLFLKDFSYVELDVGAATVEDQSQSIDYQQLTAGLKWVYEF